jgi:hypothetical protein
MTGFDNPLAPKRRGSYAGLIARIREWTHDALALDAATLISVNELACPEVGCPPRETVILVMPEGLPPSRATIHKAMADVEAEDVRRAFAEEAANASVPRSA